MILMGVSSQYVADSSSIADGAVSEAKLAAQACSAAKMKKEGTSGHVLTSNGAGAVPSYQATGAVATGWIVQETKVISSAVQTSDFAVALNGTTNKAYMILYKFVNDNASGASYNLRINGANVAVTRERARFEGATANFVTDTNGNLPFAASTAQNAAQEGYIIIPSAKKDYPRNMFIMGNSGAGGADFCITNALITTPSNATEITAIGFASDQTTGIGVGSQFTIMSL